MGFLLAKILLLLAVAAICGAWFAYWWFRRHYEDITLEYTRSRDEGAAWRHGFEERLAGLDASIRSIRIAESQPIDLSPVLNAVAALPIPPPVPAADLSPIDKRLTAIEHALFPLQTRLDELTGAVRGVNLTEVLERLGALQARLEDRPRPKVAVRAGSRNLLTRPAHGKPDDLTQIRDVPKVLERALHKVGVFYFWQIAQWSAEDVKYVDSQLAALEESIEGRIEREGWVNQASELAGAPSSAHPPELKH
jgi:predicted flap endonuclease-1-like 5' DNA nuclease